MKSYSKLVRAALALSTLGALASCAVENEEEDNRPAPELTEVWKPVPPLVDTTQAVPSDAIVLFDGRNADSWRHEDGRPVEWTIEDGALVVKAKTKNIQTKQAFGDIQLHLEFRSPEKVVGNGQKRGNSGLFFMMEYELQILDSHQNETYVNGQAASVYKQYAPLVNASRPPGTWQTYDVIFKAPRFNDDGSVKSPARLTALHNGVLVQNDVEIKGRTEYRGEPKYHQHADKMPLKLQDHGDPVAFRNIWVREL